MEHDTGNPPTGPENLLLQTGEDADCEESACMDLLGLEEPSDVDVLFVTFTKSADDRLDALKRHADAPPAKVGVVSVEVGGSNGGDRVEAGGGPTVRRISDPSDLTGVGIAISEFLSAWSDDGNRTVVCFESLTALLQYVDASRVFQFCNEITSKFEQAGARAHFHITPEAHERQELSVLSSLFDGRVSPADLGHGPDAGATAEETADEVAGEAEEDDPFEYAVADADDGSADGASADSDEATPPVEEESDDGTDDVTDDDADDDDVETDDAGSPNRTDDGGGDDGPPDADPADLVSSVIAGEADEAPAGPSLDADIPDPDGPDDDASDDARPEATSRRTERDESQRRLEYIGPDASSPGGSTEDADEEERAAADEGDDTADRPDKYAFYQRTTATVVGVVVMLVLISFLSAAMPVPIGTDAPVDDGGDPTPTATSEEVALADSTEENGTTATEETATPAETATPTDTSTTDSSTSRSSSSSTSGSDDGSTTEETSTPEPTPTETATPTETPSDDGSLTDVLDTDDDGDLL